MLGLNNFFGVDMSVFSLVVVVLITILQFVYFYKKHYPKDIPVNSMLVAVGFNLFVYGLIIWVFF
ncbi:MAG: hypothetical protein ACJA2A_002057 [Cycloclasticus pugetii]|jgi:hypothetical protein